MYEEELQKSVPVKSGQFSNQEVILSRSNIISATPSTNSETQFQADESLTSSQIL